MEIFCVSFNVHISFFIGYVSFGIFHMFLAFFSFLFCVYLTDIYPILIKNRRFFFKSQKIERLYQWHNLTLSIFLTRTEGYEVRYNLYQQVNLNSNTNKTNQTKIHQIKSDQDKPTRNRPKLQKERQRHRQRILDTFPSIIQHCLQR